MSCVCALHLLPKGCSILGAVQHLVSCMRARRQALHRPKGASTTGLRCSWLAHVFASVLILSRFSGRSRKSGPDRCNRLLKFKFPQLSGRRRKKKWSGPMQYEDKSGQLMMLPADMALLWDKAMRKWVTAFSSY